MDSPIITPAVREWAGRLRPGARVADSTVRPLAGGAVADRVDRVTLHLTGGHGTLDLVRKEVPALEIAGLRAAQAVRSPATAIPELVARHPPATIARARRLVGRAAGLPAVSAVLGELTPTLVHGDVHSANVLVDDGRATLIDWGSSRVGPAALDLANLVTADSAAVARYARTWQQLTGQSLSAAEINLGYRWAARQIPVQYLPWGIGHRPTRAVEAALDRIEQAIDQLAA